MALLYTNKIPHPDNFAFEQGAGVLRVRAVGDDVFHVTSDGRSGWKNPSQAVLADQLAGSGRHAASWQEDGSLRVADERGKAVLRGVARATFGRSGPAWMLQFRNEPGTRFYGLGEHSDGFEKSGQRVKFWNTDLIGDYPFNEIRDAHPNPMYVAVPWMIVKRGNRCVGILVNHPGEVFMDLASNFIWASENTDDAARRSFYVGAPNGEPDVYVIVGPDFAGVTKKLQRLVGCTPLPPLWALGYHQCKWGYAGPADLNHIDEKLRAHDIPCDAVWLDIDYMDRYRVFTFAKKHWGGAAAVKRTLRALRERGRRVVAILDPGVKRERGYDVCDDGLARDVFCHNPAGGPFVGFVWPGFTYFPDFSLPEVRDWWAGRVKAFAETGMAAAWIDMNDPSVGATNVEAMRFDRGQQPHESYHNQYALGMAEATQAGFLAARPDERPFLVSRSAYTSQARYSAVWTGDNFSNWHHLRMAIPVTLGLSMSGLPFNGADVGGFALDTTEELITAWFQAGFLFPFFRSHCSDFVKPQEPWRFRAAACGIMARYVRLRYTFLPYLYQQFIAQEVSGDPVVRPLFYDFADGRALPLGGVDDQFMVGPALMHAPVVHEGAGSRSVVLPGKGRWFGFADGVWHRGGSSIEVATPAGVSPLFGREGTIIALRAGGGVAQEIDLRVIELHVLLDSTTRSEARLAYSADDGLSFGYQRGERTTVTFLATCSRSGELTLRTQTGQSGFGRLRVRVVVYGDVTEVRWARDDVTTELKLRRFAWTATGVRLAVRAADEIEV